MRKIISTPLLFILLLSLFSFNNKEQIFYEDITNIDPKKESIIRGEKVYTEHCLRCHLSNGKGDADIPPVAGSDWLINKRAETIHAIKYGLKGKIIVNNTEYKGFMPKQKITPQQVADVMNYIMNSWGSTSEKLVIVEEVERVEK